MLKHLVRTTLELEQYQCRNCGRFFYISKMDRSDLDIDFGCPYGCDDNGKHTRNLHTEIKEVQDITGKNKRKITKIKLSKEEFWNKTTTETTDYGVMLRTKTDICQYGQAYKKGISKGEYKQRYLDFYYRLYLTDCEQKVIKSE